MKHLVMTILALFPMLTAWAGDNGDEQAIRKSAAAYVAAFNKGDAAGIAKLFAKDTEYTTSDGRHLKGRQSIEQAMAKLFSEGDAGKLSLGESTIRLVSPEVAMEEGVAALARPGEEPEETKYLAVHVKEEGDWKIHTLRETAVAAAARAPSAKHLEELAWLVGQWSEGSSSETLCSFAWTKNGSFVAGHFRHPAGESEDLEGTQVIGWDPATGVIRSWLFDSDGSFGAGVWTRNDNQWQVEFRQVLPDGRRATATNLYTLLDENTFTWQSTERTLEGEPLEDLPAVKFSRKAASAEKTKKFAPVEKTATQRKAKKLRPSENSSESNPAEGAQQ